METTGTISAKPKAKKLPYLYAVGRRKTASARVRFHENAEQPAGSIVVNEKKAQEYFTESEYGVIDELLRLNTSGLEGHFTVKVAGSGKHSQAEAVRHGIARILIQIHPDMRATVKPRGFLTRDSRRKERKKPGLKRARKSPQWSKR